jgi:DNA modification methylase
VKLSALTPDTRNANRGTARGRKMVRESLKRYGAGRSILLDKSGNIIAGNKTVEGALAMGMEDVQIVKSDGTKLIAVQRTDLDINDRAARELGIADNRASELGLDWDLDVLKEFKIESVDLAPFWDDRGLSGLLGEPMASSLVPDPKLEQAAALVKKWDTKRGQLWSIGKHRLLCGESTSPEDVAKLLDGAKIDALVTDPPYCSGGFQESGRSAGSIGSDAKIKASIANDRLSSRGYMALLKAALGLSGASMAYIFTDWRMWVNLFDVAESSGYGVRNMIVWNKGTPGMGMGWRSQHEIVMFAARDMVKFDNHKAVGNVITLDRTGNPLHPTQKPVELIETLLQVADMAATVYDPFLGSGTVLAAAQTQGRTCYALEIEPKYVAVALQRMADMGLKPELSNG